VTMTLQLCAILVTIALMVIAIAAIRTMRRFEKAADEFIRTAEAVRHSVSKAEAAAESIRNLAPRVTAVVERFEDISNRTARLSNSVLNEIETPVREAVAMLRGLKTGAGALFRNLVARPHRSTLQGGSS
jgi:uncharacterized protein YoxC